MSGRRRPPGPAPCRPAAAAADGLLAADADADWLGDTAALAGAAGTCLLAIRILGWNPGRPEQRLRTTRHRLAAAARAGGVGPGSR